MPLGSTGEVFAKFRELAGAEQRGEGKQQFLYRPGAREDRVLLVAHADTVWDNGSRGGGAGGRILQEIVNQEGIIRNKQGGLGADDRAGCAIVWLLRNLGHSLLIVDGEESGRQGSHWLMEANADIRNEINDEHNFVIQFDRRNGTDYKCYDVGTQEFKTYIEAMTGYIEPDPHSYTDIVTLCHRVPGANLSVGYRNEHSVNEHLVVKEWEHTLNLCRRWLRKEELPKFRREEKEWTFLTA